jgi:hypothetical protein
LIQPFSARVAKQTAIFFKPIPLVRNFMRITALRLKNFRSHIETTLELDRFNFVRGPNGSGKSSIPIYLSFILLMLGLSVWLNDLWLLVTLVPAVGFIGAVVIPREERFLEQNFQKQYSSYKTAVRRWL